MLAENRQNNGRSERLWKHIKITPCERKAETYKLAASERREYWDEETLTMRDRVQKCDVSVVNIARF
jgi:hypothetical protein